MIRVPHFCLHVTVSLSGVPIESTILVVLVLLRDIAIDSPPSLTASIPFTYIRPGLEFFHHKESFWTRRIQGPPRACCTFVFVDFSPRHENDLSPAFLSTHHDLIERDPQGPPTLVLVVW